MFPVRTLIIHKSFPFFVTWKAFFCLFFSLRTLPFLHSKLLMNKESAFNLLINLHYNNNNNNLLKTTPNVIKLNQKWKLFLPNWSWARQPLSSARSTLLYPLFLNAKQGSWTSRLLTYVGMTRPGFEPTTSRLWGGRSTDWANTPVLYIFLETVNKKK